MDCIVCRKPFLPRPHKFTCGRRCAKVRQQTLRRIAEGHAQGRNCAECGVLYCCLGQASKTYCSPECRQEHKRRRDREVQLDKYYENRESLLQKRREDRQANPETARRRDAEKYQKIAADPAKREIAREAGRRHYANRRLEQGLPYRTAAEYHAERRAAVEQRAAIAEVVEPQACAYCGRPIQTDRRRKYCSAQCYRWGTRPQATEVPLMTGLEGAALNQAPPEKVYFSNCICGRRFGSHSIHAKFCSKECRKLSLTERRRTGSAEIPTLCVVCGKEFAATRRNARTCSADCRAEHHRRTELIRSKEPQTRERQKLLSRRRKHVQASCTICGRDMSHFENLKINRYTCSPECRDEAFRRKQHRAYEKRRDRGNVTGTHRVEPITDNRPRD